MAKTLTSLVTCMVATDKEVCIGTRLGLLAFLFPFALHFDDWLFFALLRALQVAKNSAKIKDADRLGIPVVDIAFLEECKKKGW